MFMRFLAGVPIGIGMLGLLLNIVVTRGIVQAAPERPNILFIMSDDHAYQAISAYGSNRNKTPHIDRIAAEGMRFDRCYVTNSICGPSRACILTGKYSHKNGFYDNQSTFDGSQTTLPKLLQQAGYQTAIVGKWHLVSEPTGFDHWEILPGQGDYYRPTFITPAGRHNVPGYVTDVTTQKAIDWLRDGRDTSKPFFLMVHHKAPHRRWDPPVKYLTMFAERADCRTGHADGRLRQPRHGGQARGNADRANGPRIGPQAVGPGWADAHLALQSHDAGRAGRMGEARRSATGGIGKRKSAGTG